MKELGTWERLIVSSVILAFIALLGVNIAKAERFALGNLLVDFHLDSAPNKLPKHENAPIDFWGSGDFSTKDGTTPPKLQQMIFEIDKFGKVETLGLPVCTRAKLEATTVSQAREKCRGAIVGTGNGSGIVEFPEQAPIPARTPLTFFNGPIVGGDPSVIVHAHLTIPAPTTYLVPLRIERIRKGVFGFRIESNFPAIAGGYGSITHFDFRFDRKWNYRGKRLSYVYARCTIGRLQARFNAKFSDGTNAFGLFVHPCQVRS
ncbi:MAG TPA: hypothetical protein VF255_06455 [Solirubrobacterales bacterium]